MILLCQKISDFLFTKKGFWTYVITVSVLGTMVFFDPSKPATYLAGPSAALVGIVLVFICSIAAMVGDLFADRVIRKIFAHPNPKNLLHQTVYFLFSIAGLLLGLLLLNLGDDEVRGYWHR